MHDVAMQWLIVFPIFEQE